MRACLGEFWKPSRHAGLFSLTAALALQVACPRAASAQEGTALEYVGTVVTTNGTVLVGAGSDNGAYPCVHISVTEGAANPSASPNTCYPALNVRAWVLRAADSLAALIETPHRGRVREFGGNPVVHFGTMVAAGFIVKDGPATAPIYGLMIFKAEGAENWTAWLTRDDAKKLIVFIGRASDRSVDMSPEFALRDSYRRIFPTPHR